MADINNGHGRVRVVDAHGRTGTAYYRSGYVSRGTYINPYWDIRWDPQELSEEEAA